MPKSPRRPKRRPPASPWGHGAGGSAFGGSLLPAPLVGAMGAYAARTPFGAAPTDNPLLRHIVALMWPSQNSGGNKRGSGSTPIDNENTTEGNKRPEP